ncbi:polyribonucleotide nucleotidyltransferase [Candidatus Gromoviella agglomerans]|uniref:polyribonucleotide nucleotidyltransferase n=1 Tax=Candidatus Gromoviella agglomerans TaxID=2806609 RepID=UPI001E3543CD|nr:polyribonucleotide nucleotidyltransferase [Candidatus Gromoviella agglomerans]
MLKILRKEMEYNGKVLSVETARIARNVASVYATYGRSSVLCTVSVGKDRVEDIQFIPLKVTYQEKDYAFGRIPGGFLKREGRQSNSEILISRTIDRIIRPTIHKMFRNETQIVCELKDFEQGDDVEILSIIAAEIAIHISPVPVVDFVAPCRVGLLNGHFTTTATNEMDMVVAGNEDGIVMLEARLCEVPQQQVVKAIEFAMNKIDDIYQFINDFVTTFIDNRDSFAVRYSRDVEIEDHLDLYEDLMPKLCDLYEKLYDKSWYELNDVDQERICDEIVDKFREDYPLSVINVAITDFKKISMRTLILSHNRRIDGRGVNDIRNISCDMGLLKNSHGSALFSRGFTQAFVSVVLGSPDDCQVVEEFGLERRENFMFHYNFPQFAVGEVSKSASPGRREIGHGALAKKAISSVLPEFSEFPYSIRVVSDITESDGSSSMASVCGAICALRNANVPIKSNVAGIAIGVVSNEDEYVIISDINSVEDDLGDMDFKITGTENGINAIQLDVKKPIPLEVIIEAMKYGVIGLKSILGVMDAIIGYIEDFDENAVITRITVGREKLKELINRKILRDICIKTGCKITPLNGDVIIFGHPLSRSNAKMLIDDILIADGVQ